MSIYIATTAILPLPHYCHPDSSGLGQYLKINNCPYKNYLFSKSTMDFNLNGVLCHKNVSSNLVRKNPFWKYGNPFILFLNWQEEEQCYKLTLNLFVSLKFSNQAQQCSLKHSHLPYTQKLSANYSFTLGYHLCLISRHNLVGKIYCSLSIAIFFLWHIKPRVGQDFLAPTPAADFPTAEVAHHWPVAGSSGPTEGNAAFHGSLATMPMAGHLYRQKACHKVGGWVGGGGRKSQPLFWKILLALWQTFSLILLESRRWKSNIHINV